MGDLRGDQSMAWYCAAAVGFEMPTMLLGTPTSLLIGDSGGPRVGISNSQSGRTTSPAASLCYNRQRLFTALRLHNVPTTRSTENIIRVLVHDGEVLATVDDNSTNAHVVQGLDHVRDGQADTALRAVEAVPDLFSALVTLSHRQDGTPAVRQIRPTLKLDPFYTEGELLARTILQREFVREGLPVRTAAQQVRVDLTLHNADASTLEQTLPSACVARNVISGNVTTTDGQTHTQVTGAPLQIADLMMTIMGSGITGFPPTLTIATPAGA